MRPISLTMKAFGSYAQEVTVEFKEIGSGLYLITGDTGAGKTTIFDAIVFALFGQASGKTRDAKMMHSDYVGRDTETEVVFQFEHGGELHKVSRRIRFIKNRATGEYKEYKIEGDYWEAGKGVINNPSEITKRIEEQIGLNVEQFRKIVMLAQGEFRRFLDSKEDERGQILKQLFDFDVYTRYQNWVEDTFASLEQKRSQYVMERATIMGAFLMPDHLGEEEKAQYAADNPYLLQCLEELVSQDETLVFMAKEEKEKQEKAVEELALQIQKAKNDNKTLQEFFAAGKEVEELIEQKDHYAELDKAVKRSSIALHRVNPLEHVYEDKKKTLEDLKSLILDLEEKESKQILLVQEAEKKVETAHETDEKLRNLIHQVQILTDSLPAYQELEKLQKSKELLGVQLKQCENEIQLLQGKLEKGENHLLHIEKELEELLGVEGEAAEARYCYEEAKKKAEKFGGERGIKKDFTQILQKERELKSEKEAYLLQIKKTQKARELYDRHYGAFLENQAGHLAEKLKADIEETQGAYCPVCHTFHSCIPKQGFAENSETASTENMVNEAKKAFEKEEEIRLKIESQCKTGEQLLKNQKASLLQNVKDLFEQEICWEELVLGQFLERKEAQLREDVFKAKERYEKATRKQMQKVRLGEEKQELKKCVETKKEQLKTLESESEKGKIEFIKTETAIEEKRKGLSYSDKETAIAEKEKFAKEKETLERVISLAEQEKSEKQQKLSELSGRLTASREQLPNAIQEEGNARDEFYKAIAANAFEDYNEYMRALPKDGERWIDRNSQAILDYQTKRKLAEATFERCKREANGLEYQEIKKLEEEQKKEQEKKKQLEERFVQNSSARDSHRKTLLAIDDIQNSLKQTESVSKRLQRLARITNGTLGEGGRYSFERYVMGASFREILEAANIRLLIMSNGRYELKHTTEGKRKNAQSGLGILVYDNGTGKTREANSISGGESFQVSMALALGLSDVVQRHAGGYQIEAMFIDEGFGSLSDEALDQAIQVLNQLSDDKKQVGIISHVARLEELIGRKIIVQSDAKKGSSIKLCL